MTKDFPDMFEYEVNPENQCQGLNIWAKEGSVASVEDDCQNLGNLGF